MTTPVRTTIPRTAQKQQNYDGRRKPLHAGRSGMIQTMPQDNRNAQPFSSHPSSPDNVFNYSPHQQVTQRVHQLPSLNRSGGSSGYGNNNRYQFTSPNTFPSSSQQSVTQRTNEPRVYQPFSTPRTIGINDNTVSAPVYKHNTVSAPVYKHYNTSAVCGETGATSRKKKEEDKAKKRREMQDQMKRDAEDYLRRKKEKEQKKREDYIVRHKFMFPDLFGGHKLGDSNNENFHENLQPEIDAAVDPVTLRIQQEEARRKMQDEYDAKAKEHAEKIKKAEEAKHTQRVEMAAKMKAEADKYKVGRRNTEADENKHREPDLRKEQEETRRKIQGDYDMKAMKHAERMNQVEEEKKRTQQAELVVKMNAEVYKHTTGLPGLQNITPSVNTRREPVIQLSENVVTRKTQDRLDKNDLQNNSCITVNTNYLIQMNKSCEQEINKDDLDYKERLDAHHYKYGLLPAVPTLRLRLNSVNNTVKKEVNSINKEFVKNNANISKFEEELRCSEHVPFINDTTPADKEKEFHEEMRRARLKMQEAMNLKVQELQAKSEKETDFQ